MKFQVATTFMQKNVVSLDIFNSLILLLEILVSFSLLETMEKEKNVRYIFL